MAAQTHSKISPTGIKGTAEARAAVRMYDYDDSLSPTDVIHKAYKENIY